MSLFFVTDLSQGPVSLALPNSDSLPSASVDLPSWPNHILIFGCGGWPDSGVSVVVVCDDVVEELGVLSAANPFIHKVFPSPVTSTSAVRLVANFQKFESKIESADIHEEPEQALSAGTQPVRNESEATAGDSNGLGSGMPEPDETHPAMPMDDHEADVLPGSVSAEESCVPAPGENPPPMSKDDDKIDALPGSITVERGGVPEPDGSHPTVSIGDREVAVLPGSVSEESHFPKTDEAHPAVPMDDAKVDALPGSIPVEGSGVPKADETQPAVSMDDHKADTLPGSVSVEDEAKEPAPVVTSPTSLLVFSPGSDGAEVTPGAGASGNDGGSNDQEAGLYVPPPSLPMDFSPVGDSEDASCLNVLSDKEKSILEEDETGIVAPSPRTMATPSPGSSQTIVMPAEMHRNGDAEAEEKPSALVPPPVTPTTICSSQPEESQDAGYGTEKSPSVIVTPAIPSRPSPPSSTASSKVTFDLPTVELTPGGSAPVFDEEDSDVDSEVPWPPSTQPGYDKTPLRARESQDSLSTPMSGKARPSPRPTSSGRGRKRKAARWSSAKRRKLNTSMADSPANSNVEKTMSARWGHAACLIDDNNVLVLGGEGTGKRTPRDSLLRVTIGETSSGNSVTCSDVDCNDMSCPERRTGHTAVLDPDNKMLYMYGGSKGKRWFSDVHALDLTAWTWQKLETKGVAPCRSYHSCSFFRRECLVFGGVFPNPDPEPDGSSNDLFIFSLSEQNWYKPVVTGDIPAPRSGHCASRIGHHLYIFGGWDYPMFFNDLFVLDLELMEFRQLTASGSGPSPRTWHSMAELPDNQLLVYGGYTGDGDVALNDAYTLGTDTESCSWSSVASESPLLSLPARAGHTLTATPEAEDGTLKLLVCGGGDNDGKFFSDLLVVNSREV